MKKRSHGLPPLAILEYMRADYRFDVPMRYAVACLGRASANLGKLAKEQCIAIYLFSRWVCLIIKDQVVGKILVCISNQPVRLS